MSTLTVTFTGVCAFVQRGTGPVIVLIPNERAPEIQTHGTRPHFHTTPHLPHIIYTPEPGVVEHLDVLPLFSFMNDGNKTVLPLNDLAGEGLELFIKAIDGSLPTDKDFDLDIVDMVRVVGNETGRVDPALIDLEHDPIPSRIAARMEIRFGVLESVEPRPEKAVLSQFKPKPAFGAYAGVFPQEVRWEIELDGAEYHLMGRVFGSKSTVRTLLKFRIPKDARHRTSRSSPKKDVRAKSKKFEIIIGNTTFEDILQTGIGRDEVIDHHFAAYYKLLEVIPEAQPLPYRSSTPKDWQARSGGGNCPPAKLSGGG